MKPADDPRADMLVNKNLSPTETMGPNTMEELPPEGEDPSDDETSIYMEELVKTLER
jgi:hypothetical protein